MKFETSMFNRKRKGKNIKGKDYWRQTSQWLLKAFLMAAVTQSYFSVVLGFLHSHCLLFPQCC